jgi:chromosome segregation ATPase
MSDTSNVARNLRERFGGTTEERLGRALSDLLENPLLTGALGRAFDAREKAVQAQEVAMGALNLPSAADIERLTRRLRSVSHRLEGIEDGVDRLDRALAPSSADPSEIGQRLSAIEAELKRLSERIDQSARPASAAKAKSPGAKAARRGAKAATRAAHPATRATKPATARARPEQA